MGRQRKYDRDKCIAEICERLERGEPLRAICREPHMPSEDSVEDWVREDEDFSRRVARARERGFDAIADDALGIVDELPDTYMTECGPRIDPASVQRAKNRAETRLKLLACWDPRRYGQKIQQEVDMRVTDALAERLDRARQRLKGEGK